MITTVLLDLDDTILDFHKAEKEALKKALQKVGVEPTEKLLAITVLKCIGAAMAATRPFLYRPIPTMLIR